MAKKFKLDVFRVLKALDENDKEFYNNLTDEEQKEFGGWLTMRWASSCHGSPEHYLLYVNDLVNVNFSMLADHKELIWKLLSICGTGKKERHIWIPPPKKEKKSKIHEEVFKLYPLYKEDEIDILIQLNSKEELRELFLNNAFTDKEIKDILK